MSAMLSGIASTEQEYKLNIESSSNNRDVRKRLEVAKQSSKQAVVAQLEGNIMAAAAHRIMKAGGKNIPLGIMMARGLHFCLRLE